jgi:glycosyltransferase involved in cell wall biosynthesis
MEPMKFSVIIPTYNRADELRRTIRSMAGLSVAAPWELIVVDNKSTDDTRAVVEQETAAFPASLRYVHEPEQGRYAAMNTGIRSARGSIIVSTDDDARFEPDWLQQADAGLARLNCDYVGGKVLPLWGGERPAWLPNRGGWHWAVLALQDHGPKPLEFGVNRIPWPLGINIATRREAFERAGLFDNQLGRKAGTLRNQAQREWHLRAKAAGLRGFYVPEMVVHHVVEPERLRKAYFRRWYYWHGISRAILFRKLGVDMESPDESQLDFSKVPQIGGVPRYMYRAVGRHLLGRLRAAGGGDPVEAFEHELWLCFFAGVVKQRWADRREAIPPAQNPHVTSAPTEMRPR